MLTNCHECVIIYPDRRRFEGDTQVTSELTAVVEESVETGEGLFFSEGLSRQTALIEFLSVAAAVLIVIAVVFIIFRIKRKNRGQD